MAVRRVPNENLDEAMEGWESDGVFLYRWENGDSWAVEVGAMEFLRGGSEGDVRQAIDAALRTVPGVEDVREEDRSAGPFRATLQARRWHELSRLPYSHLLTRSSRSRPARSKLDVCVLTRRRSRMVSSSATWSRSRPPLGSHASCHRAQQ